MSPRLKLLILGLLCIGFSTPYLPAYADSSASTTATSSPQQSQADQTQQQIDSLESQIQQLQIQLNNTTAQKQTLQSAINALNLQIQTLTKSISLTNAQIRQTNAQISTLSGSITTTQGQIGQGEQGVADSLREVEQSDSNSLFISLLGGGTLSSFFSDAVTLQSVRNGLESKIEGLSNLKTNLQTSKSAAQTKSQRLSALESNLAQQKQGLLLAQASQTQLLKQTKDQESSYQQLIATKQAQELSFENALAQIQKGLAPISSGTVPPAGQGILQWPFSASVMATCRAKARALGNQDCITQYFGNTDFATQNPQIYNNMGHDGVDIGVPIGTPVEAALDGVVLATGDTDVRGPSGQMCYSFGKWVMLTHPNGLATLYAHLSDNTVVQQGETVSTGQLIGYSGMTGYATGPHLHFGVYAASGVQITTFGHWRGTTGPCASAGAILPFAPTNAYLNPLSYLP